MNSRMDKYTDSNIKSRSEKNKELYEKIKNSEIEKFDASTNATILEEDIVRIDVDKVRDMLDKRYRDDITRKTLEIKNDEEEVQEKQIDTKEYDINTILEKAREKQEVDYEKERLKKVHDTQYDILKNLNVDNNGEIQDTEENIMNLINTITELELKNKESKKNENTALDLLSELSDNDTESVYKTMELDKDELTSDLKVKKENDEKYEDFQELENDLKSNNIAIKVVGIVFLIILVILVVIFVNKYFKLGLF